MGCVQFQRRERFPVELAATVTVDGRDSFPCVMHNISQDGCRIVSETTLPIGANIEIHEERLGTLSATVRWSLMGSAGCRFTD